MTIIDDLKSRLVGKTIDDITPSFRAGAICEIHYSSQVDGIYKKELLTLTIGQHQLWVLDSLPKNMGEYLDLIADYRLYGKHEKTGASIESLPEPIVKRTDGQISIDAFDGTVFSLNISIITSRSELKILRHPQVESFLGKIVDLGDCWRMAFLNNSADDCIPHDLLVTDIDALWL